MVKSISIFKKLFAVMVVAGALLLSSCAAKITNPTDVAGYAAVDVSSAKDYPQLAKWLKPLSGKFTTDRGSSRPATIFVTSILPGGKEAKITYHYGMGTYDSNGKPKMSVENKTIPDIIGTFVDENTLVFKFGSRSTITCRWQANGEVMAVYEGSGNSSGTFREVPEQKGLIATN